VRRFGGQQFECLRKPEMDALRAVLDLCDAADTCPIDGTTPITACDCYPDEYHDRDVYAPNIRRAIAEKLGVEQ
jgi:hypothetical protein